MLAAIQSPLKGMTDYGIVKKCFSQKLTDHGTRLALPHAFLPRTRRRGFQRNGLGSRTAHALASGAKEALARKWHVWCGGSNKQETLLYSRLIDDGEGRFR